MQSEWQEGSLGDLVDFKPRRIIKKGISAPFISMADVPENSRAVSTYALRDFSGGGSRFQNGDTIFARITPCLENGKTAKVDGLPTNSVAHGSTEFIVLAARQPDYDQDFIYYLARLPEFRKFAEARMEGTSGRQRVSWQSLSDYQLIFPPKENRKEIGDFLAAFDDKIELNRQMNATLEAMAQALFKSWFVDFDPVLDNALASGNPIPDELQEKAAAREALGDARKPLPEDIAALFPAAFVWTEEMGWIPEGWEVAAFAKIAKLNPDAWTKKNEPNSVNYVDLSNTKDGRILSVTHYPFSEAPSRARRILKTDDTIIGTVRPGNRSFAYVQQDGLTGSTGFAVMRPRKLFYRSFVYFGLTQDVVIDMFAHLADGAAYPAIRPEVVSSASVVLPLEDQLLKRFDDLAHPWLKKIGDNEQLSERLAELRDTLLPKLLSGELRIPDVEKLVEEVI